MVTPEELINHTDFGIEEEEVRELLAFHEVRKYRFRQVKLGSLKRWKDGHLSFLKDTVNYRFLHERNEETRAAYTAYCADPANRQDNPDRSPENYLKLQERILEEGYDPGKGVIIIDQFHVILGGVHRACILLDAYGDAYEIPVLQFQSRAARRNSWKIILQPLKGIKGRLRRLPAAVRRSALRRQLKTRSFTLLSQNCLGGAVYDMFGLPFETPTINVFIEDENFVKLAEDPAYYLSRTPVPVTERYVEPLDPSIQYPKIRIEDIEICCLHEKNCTEAIENWERRRKRVRYDRLFVIANTWNLHDDLSLIDRIRKLPVPHVIFTDLDLAGDDIVKLRGDLWYRDQRGIVRPNLTDMGENGKRLFEEQFDFLKWINENS